MKIPSRVTMICLLALGLRWSLAQPRGPRIARPSPTTDRKDLWPCIRLGPNRGNKIRYTWNGEISGVFKLSRAWEWEPKTGKVLQ